MAAHFEVEKASGVVKIEAAYSDDKTGTASDVAKLICPSSCYFWRSCLLLMSHEILIPRYNVIGVFLTVYISSHFDTAHPYSFRDKNSHKSMCRNFTRVHMQS